MLNGIPKGYPVKLKPDYQGIVSQNSAFTGEHSDRENLLSINTTSFLTARINKRYQHNLQGHQLIERISSPSMFVLYMYVCTTFKVKIAIM